MKPYTLLIAVLPLSVTWAASVDPDKLPKVACTELHYSSAFLEKFPRAPAACLEARVYKGARYVKFRAKVNIVTPAFLTVQLLNTVGDPLDTFSFKPSPTAHVLIDGEQVAFKDVRIGEVLTVWVPEKRLVVTTMPASTKDSWTVYPPDPSVTH